MTASGLNKKEIKQSSIGQLVASGIVKNSKFLTKMNPWFHPHSMPSIIIYIAYCKPLKRLTRLILGALQMPLKSISIWLQILLLAGSSSSWLLLVTPFSFSFLTGLYLGWLLGFIRLLIQLIPLLISLSFLRKIMAKVSI